MTDLRPESRISALEKRMTKVEGAIEELASDQAEGLKMIRQEIKQGHMYIGQSIDDHSDAIMKEIRKHTEPIERRLDRVETRLDTIEGRFDKVETRLDTIEGRLDRVETTMATKDDIKNMATKDDLAAMEARLIDAVSRMIKGPEA
jgi:DNA repair exonuclease SbcCD ATPase subunit